MAGAFAAEIALRYAAELVVDDGEEILERGGIAIFPAFEQNGNWPLLRGGHRSTTDRIRAG